MAERIARDTIKPSSIQSAAFKRTAGIPATSFDENLTPHVNMRTKAATSPAISAYDNGSDIFYFLEYMRLPPKNVCTTRARSFFPSQGEFSDRESDVS